LELSIHEEPDVIHEEYNLVRASYLEEGIFCLQWTLGHCEVFFNVVGLVLLFVRADYMNTVVTHVGGQLIQTEFLGLLELLCLGIEKDDVPLLPL
jgi:hypothetical protein